MIRSLIIIIIMVATCDSSERTVILRMKTTGCRDGCLDRADTVCRSSIMVNGVEKSKQKDGFNIVVLDNFGRVTRSDNTGWFNDYMFWKRSEFKKIFRNIQVRSTVIIVLQNMCNKVTHKWYTLLSGLKINHGEKQLSYQGGIIVGCKGECPSGDPIPFSIFVNKQPFVKTITLKFGGVPKDPSSHKNTDEYADDVPIIVGGVIGVIILFIVIYSVYLYFRRRDEEERRRESFLLFDARDNRNINTDRTQENTGVPTIPNNEPVYQQIEHRLPSAGNIYETPDRSWIKSGSANAVPEYVEPKCYPTVPPPEHVESNVQIGPSAPPLSQYTHVDSKEFNLVWNTIGHNQ